MRFEGAVVREQGVTFAIAVVKRHVLSSQHEASRASVAFSRIFPRMPIVLMAQDHRGVPTYRGRRDIVRFLASVPMSAIPWKRYTVS